MFQFPGFPPSSLCVQLAVAVGSTAGFPHSDIAGSQPAHDSPALFAVCHVLHRLLTPRHPPFAFSRLSRHTETAHHLYVCLARMLLPIRLLKCRVINPLADNRHTVGFCFAKPLSLDEVQCTFASFASKPVGLSRLERLTSPLSEECSNRLSYRPKTNRRSGRGMVPILPEHTAFHST
jgi:hypothetical protein